MAHVVKEMVTYPLVLKDIPKQTDEGSGDKPLDMQRYFFVDSSKALCLKYEIRQF